MLTFDEKTHTYELDGKKLISVTQLMKKHGLIPNYDKVPKEMLHAKAERGTLIHEEIEAWIKKSEIGFTKETANFIQYTLNNNIEIKASELQLHNDIVAGTCDLILNDKGQNVIADIKTTYQLHKESVSWQLSIYLYLYLEWDYDEWWDSYKGQAFHFNKDGELNVVDIPLKPYQEIARLMVCERKGEIFSQTPEVLNVDLQEVIELENLIKYCESQKKNAEERSKKLKEAILKEMEDRNLQSIEKDGIKITYVSPTTRKTIDSTALKKDYPEIAEKYTKETQIKATLRISWEDKE